MAGDYDTTPVVDTPISWVYFEINSPMLINILLGYFRELLSVLETNTNVIK